MMGWNIDGGAWLAMTGMMLLWLVLGVVVVWLIVRGLVALERPRADGHDRATAEEVLRDRLARGEIEPDEYERRLALLRRP